MRVIVTGGSGRIGKAVIFALAERGHQLVNIDRRPPRDQRPAKFVYLDVRERHLLQPLMEKCDAIIHMGEIPNVFSGHYSPNEVFGINTSGSAQVLQIAAELKLPRILYTSSIQAYGTSGPGAKAWLQLPISEEHPLTPQNAYGAGKVAVETYARMLCQTTGCSIAAFRLPGVLMEEPKEYWFRRAETADDHGVQLAIYVRDFDVAEAFALALEKQQPGFHAYNLSMRELGGGFTLAESMRRHYPHLTPLGPEWSGYRSPYLWEKAHRHFGWTPRWNFLDVFRERYGRDPRPILADV